MQSENAPALVCNNTEKKKKKKNDARIPVRNENEQEEPGHSNTTLMQQGHEDMAGIWRDRAVH